MGFQLETDEWSESEKKSFGGLKLDTDSVNTDYEHNTNSSTESNNTTIGNKYSDFEDDSFDPAQEDSVYIANRYHQTSPDTASSNTSSNSASLLKHGFPPVLLVVGIVLMFLYISSIVSGIENCSNATEFTTMVQSQIPLAFLYQGCFLADAIIVCITTKRWGLLAWAILFHPVYFFQRCSATRHSKYWAIGVLLAEIAILAFGFSKMSQTIPDLVKATVAEESITSFKNNIDNVTYSIDGQQFTLSQLINANFSQPEYRYEELPNNGGGSVVVSGTINNRGFQYNLDIYCNPVNGAVIGYAEDSGSGRSLNISNQGAQDAIFILWSNASYR